MRKILTFLSIMATLVLFVACGNSKPAEGEQKKDGGEKQVAQSADVKKNIAVVYSTGGKGDKSFFALHAGFATLISTDTLHHAFIPFRSCISQTTLLSVIALLAPYLFLRNRLTK